jgi:hypothetical protein
MKNVSGLEGLESLEGFETNLNNIKFDIEFLNLFINKLL